MLNTTSMFITFHGRLEDSIGAFYGGLAGVDRFSSHRGVFLELAAENRRHKEMVLRAYREVVTDAFEGGFPLRNLDEGDYDVDAGLPDDAGLPEVLARAVEMEAASLRFCEDAAGSTRGLMADVPEAFEWVARRKARRIGRLESLG